MPETADKKDRSIMWRGLGIFILVTALVFILLYVGDSEKYKDSPYGVYKWTHKHSSDILMSVLVAFLALVLYFGEKFREELEDHRNSWNASKEKLESYGKELTETKEDLITLKQSVREETEKLSLLAKEETKKLGHLAENMIDIHNLAEKSVNPGASLTLKTKSFALTRKWADIILREDKWKNSTVKEAQTEKALQYAVSKCIELLYESYVEEEIRDIDISSNLNIPLITTNYPTYLNFIDNIARNFVAKANLTNSDFSELRPVLQDHKVCIITLANVLPIEFLMHCKTVDGKCGGINASLPQWRNTSNLLSNMHKQNSCFFRRVFITSDYNFISHLPKTKAFNILFESCHIWYPSDDPNLERGFPGGLAEKLVKQLKIKNACAYNHNTNIFLISTDNQIPTDIPLALRDEQGNIIFYINNVPLSVKSFLVNKLHDNNPDCVRHLDINTEGLFNSLQYQEGFPTDMFLIGIIPNNKSEIINKNDVEPIMGVACLFSNSTQNVSVLKVYTRENFKGQPIWDWIVNVVTKSKPLQNN